MEKVLIIIGPTAVGKTALSVKIAKLFNGEIINGDSVQVYKKFNIGSAKITEKEMEGIKHHLLSFKEPDEDFSVAEFQHLVRSKISEISNLNKLPIIAGGTGLYIQSVLYDFRFQDEGRDLTFSKRFEHLSNEDLHQLLSQIDIETAKVIHPNNRIRVLRALEIFENAKKAKSDLINEQKKDLLYDALIIGLDLERETLYNRINKRVDMMMEQGLLDEAKSLYESGYHVQAIGYREFKDYFEGNKSLEDVTDDIKKNTRHYAKRQLTYFRNKLEVNWFNVDLNNFQTTVEEISTYINHWLSK
ncbi:MAG: tRNA ((37)-N6)-dimethylallyltransferase MiaA [Haloplasmataceae bacterium]|jgi:tRNA dimethylallyltransferase|nr:tRNA ((37)-N6)-dimethylallyltransferase MiaA [Haloplasmataceae bacterium]